jgi:hypothetical protein
MYDLPCAVLALLPLHMLLQTRLLILCCLGLACRHLRAPLVAPPGRVSGAYATGSDSEGARSTAVCTMDILSFPPADSSGPATLSYSRSMIVALRRFGESHGRSVMDGSTGSSSILPAAVSSC